MRGFVILDFGSQFTQLIARRLRELGFYSEIHSFEYPAAEIRKKNPYGIILSGGPNSVYEKGSPQRDVTELRNISPVMGVCYGMQLLTHQLGGKVAKAEHREYGLNYVTWSSPVPGVPQKQKVWMSHGDVVEKVPEGFSIIGMSDGNHPAAMQGPGVLAVQFHPEVAHTDHGVDLLKYFASGMCQAQADWDAPHIKDMLIRDAQEKVGPTDHVLVGLSGGVDSTVVATLLTKALGAERVHCVFVDNGLLRKNEFENVLESYRRIGLNVKGVDASEEFLSELKGKSDPEEKRKTIGRVFIEIFDKSYDHKLPIKWLAQGTLYPDVIESVSSVGGSVTIKSHHNVGGLPEKMKLGLVEPVRELFKDEVRALGAQLGLPAEMLWRHPFPGPGLAIRVLGEVTKEKLQILKEADEVYISELRRRGLYEKIWQAFCVLLPVKTVGVQGDSRTYDHVLALRAVTSSDGMTADWYPFDFEFLREVSNLITNKVKGVNRVVYDITSKPPGTIEWE
ncbi:glutamine-hydrolyzing GMP synthase [Bdellovibrio bacteriovorus]|uniref:glutamine-hydrolyzing GMP synthase n=1 Tax=Bdellovibrio bacteriovorus TaxID=959 RepID=UPI0021D1ACB0|nr:glutamine-hydrolyzing GMP synthase [Bdellovibrio bacteriovorus]UXR63470.1 glutamine-hydrolyzing GMP synthase [Bdellovibrio bacteriovorus]